MTELVSTTPGLYPLPDRAKDELADLKGHQKGDLVPTDDPEVTDAYDRARREVVDRQQEAGLASCAVVGVSHLGVVRRDEVPFLVADRKSVV